MKKHTVAQVGVGSRGMTHLRGFLAPANADRFDVVGLCDLDESKLRAAADEYGIDATYADAETMLAETRPDVFCFVTPPAVRLELAQLGAQHGVKAMAFEKPMATSLAEAWAITDLCRRGGIKGIVSHQQKYLTSMQKLKAVVDAGELGEIRTIHATCQAWLSQLGTHFMDYALWANGGHRARWVVGHVHGRERLTDSHPSPDYILGQALCDNGVRIYIECGHLSPSHITDRPFWVDNRLTVHGTHGYVWADTDGRWGALTSAGGGEVQTGEGELWHEQEKTHLQVDYLRDLADWLDDDANVHPCNIEMAYHGYEVLEGLCISALDHTRVDLPLADPAGREDVLERMRKELPDVTPPS